MSAPDEREQYWRLSGALRQIGRAFSSELPTATAVLHLHSPDGRTRLDVYDRTAHMIAKFPTGQLSPPLRNALESLDIDRCSDPFGVVSPLERR